MKEQTQILIDENCVVLNMRPASKEDAIRGIIEQLAKANKLKNPEAILTSVLYRESLASTGLEKGVALPHAKTSEVDNLVVGIGIVPNGVDFKSLDNKDANIIVLVVSSLNSASAHVAFLASISNLLSKEEVREHLIMAKTKAEVVKEINL